MPYKTKSKFHFKIRWLNKIYLFFRTDLSKKLEYIAPLGMGRGKILPNPFTVDIFERDKFEGDSYNTLE
jgi:hypothetical protein